MKLTNTYSNQKSEKNKEPEDLRESAQKAK